MDALPKHEVQYDPLPPAPPRLLPWPSPDGKPCFLVTDDRSSHLSQLADEMEAAQLEMGTEILDHACLVLADTMSPYSEVRYAGIRLAECLSDALRVAESRGIRQPHVPDGKEDAAAGHVPPTG
jgi:hypothetical protein